MILDLVILLSQSIMATTLHSECIMDGMIDPAYKDAHTLLVTTTDGHVFIQILIQQAHPLWGTYHIATVDIPDYLEF